MSNTEFRVGDTVAFWHTGSEFSGEIVAIADIAVGRAVSGTYAIIKASDNELYVTNMRGLRPAEEVK